MQMQIIIFVLLNMSKRVTICKEFCNVIQKCLCLHVWFASFKDCIDTKRDPEIPIFPFSCLFQEASFTRWAEFETGHLLLEEDPCLVPNTVYTVHCTLVGWSTTLCTPFLWSIGLMRHCQVHHISFCTPVPGMLHTVCIICTSHSIFGGSHFCWLQFWSTAFGGVHCSAFLLCAMTTHAIVPKSDCFVDQTFQNLPEHLHICWNFQNFWKACLGMPVLAGSKSVLKVNTFPWREKLILFRSDVYITLTEGRKDPSL